MKILIVTPLFPPDTAPSAHYAKELSRRLAINHEVTTLLYGHLPEAVPGTSQVHVDKRRTLFVRTWQLLKQLPQLARVHDVILIQNGPSVELACVLALRFSQTPIVLMESDVPALLRTLKNPFLNAIHYILTTVASCTFSRQEPWPTAKPIIHPLTPRPDAALTAWEQSWQDHLAAVHKKCLPS